MTVRSSKIGSDRLNELLLCVLKYTLMGTILELHGRSSITCICAMVASTTCLPPTRDGYSNSRGRGQPKAWIILDSTSNENSLLWDAGGSNSSWRYPRDYG